MADQKNQNQLTDYYSDPWVRRRIREYCGETASPPTCVYLSALNGDHETWDRAPRIPVEALETLLAEGADVARSMWDRSKHADPSRSRLSEHRSQRRAVPASGGNVHQAGADVPGDHQRPPSAGAAAAADHHRTRLPLHRTRAARLRRHPPPGVDCAGDAVVVLDALGTLSVLDGRGDVVDPGAEPTWASG